MLEFDAPHRPAVFQPVFASVLRDCAENTIALLAPRSWSIETIKCVWYRILYSILYDVVIALYSHFVDCRKTHQPRRYSRRLQKWARLRAGKVICHQGSWLCDIQHKVMYIYLYEVGEIKYGIFYNWSVSIDSLNAAIAEGDGVVLGLTFDARVVDADNLENVEHTRC